MISLFDEEYAFLSNFYASPITYKGLTYPTNEHFFQAMKTINPIERQAISEASTPGIAKRMGRRVSLRSDWESIKVDVMKLGLKLKFQNPELKNKLIATGDEILIEGNTWHDNTWGNCQCENCQNIIGRNLLGQCLMELREELKNA